MMRIQRIMGGGGDSSLDFQSLTTEHVNKPSTIQEAETYMEETEYNKNSIEHNGYAYSMAGHNSKPKQFDEQMFQQQHTCEEIVRGSYDMDQEPETYFVLQETNGSNEVNQLTAG